MANGISFFKVVRHNVIQKPNVQNWELTAFGASNVHPGFCALSKKFIPSASSVSLVLSVFKIASN